MSVHAEPMGDGVGEVLGVFAFGEERVFGDRLAAGLRREQVDEDIARRIYACNV